LVSLGRTLERAPRYKPVFGDVGGLEVLVSLVRATAAAIAQTDRATPGTVALVLAALGTAQNALSLCPPAHVAAVRLGFFGELRTVLLAPALWAAPADALALGEQVLALAVREMWPAFPHARSIRAADVPAALRLGFVDARSPLLHMHTSAHMHRYALTSTSTGPFGAATKPYTDTLDGWGSRAYAGTLTDEDYAVHWEGTLAHPVVADRFGHALEEHGATALLQFWQDAARYAELGCARVPAARGRLPVHAGACD
jgi:hypothetical protein